MSEASTGSTVERKRLRLIGHAKLGAGILWTLAIIGAVADITDHFPRGFVVIAAVLAGTTTAILAALSISHEDRQQILDEFTALRLLQARIAANIGEGVGRLAAEVEQVSARTDDLTEALAEVRRQQEQDRTEFDRKITEALEAAFDAGRRYTEAVDGRERKLSTVRDNI